MSSTSSSQPTQSSNQQNDLGGITASPFLYAIFVSIILLFIFCFGSVWRGLIIRRQRRLAGLPPTPPTHHQFGQPSRGMFSPVNEIPLEVPVIHEVMLSEKTSIHDKLGVLTWSGLMPLSSYVVPESTEGEKDLEAALDADPLLGVTLLGAFAELTLLPEVKRRFDLRRERREAAKSRGDNAALDTNPEPRRLTTAVMIAMPSRERHNPRTSLTKVDDEQALPEVALGTCTRLVQFDTMEPLESDGGGEVARPS